jgi:hypothetical protein
MDNHLILIHHLSLCRLVEHYSPFCHHCKAFVPTWKEYVWFPYSQCFISRSAWLILKHPIAFVLPLYRLVESRQHQEDTINFHFGQVDCAVYGGSLHDAAPQTTSLIVFLIHGGLQIFATRTMSKGTLRCSFSRTANMWKHSRKSVAWSE